MKLVEQIKNYQPCNDQEKADKTMILDCLEKGSIIFYRSHKIGHMTASAWVVNPQRTKVLMVYHNIYDSWSWMGGHADGEQDLLQVAVREVQEESGLENIRCLTDDIFSLEVLTIDGHIKHDEYVSSHLHLNLTYLLEADEDEELFVKEDENSGVAWFSLEEAVKASTEPWFRENVYSKLNEKLNSFVHAPVK